MTPRTWPIVLLAAATLGGCVVEQANDDDSGGAASADELEAPVVCMTHADCPSGDFCGFEAGVCGAQLGVCRPAPLGAADEITPDSCETAGPICGCDGRIYEDACEGWAYGVSVWREGICDAAGPAPQPGAGDSCESCGPDEICFSTDGSCGATGLGQCRLPDGPCTASLNPACGCDGNTYDTVCDALSRGVSVVHDGAC